MPELPEVESFRKQIEKTSMKKSIDSVKLLSPNMLLNTSAKAISKALEGSAFIATERHGKFLFIKLRSNGNLMLHFGLTGDVVYAKAGEDAPDKFALGVLFHDESAFYFTDTRKMGKIALVEDTEAFIKERKYGTDALKIGEKDFLEKVASKKKAIKTVLMDQNILAGVGNEYSDEILFQTRVHPSTLAMNLSGKQLREIFKQMQVILKEAVKANADRDKLSHYFFLDNRKAGLKCPRCKGETEHETIGGRSSYFCPHCQSAK